METAEERIAVLEKRVDELTDLINLMLTLKKNKVDISNFTCAPIHLEKIR